MHDSQATAGPVADRILAKLRLGPSPAGLDQLARLLLASTDVRNLAEVDADLAAAALERATACIASRRRGEPWIGVEPVDGAGGPASVLVVLNDDMPFLVDSVMGEIQARGLAAQLVLHPIFKAERTPEGRLVAVTGAGNREWADGRQESLIVVILERIDAAAGQALIVSLGDILRDVRSAVTGWKPMLARLERAIGDLEATSPRLGRERIDEPLEFLRWLKDGNFTFLGMRELRLTGSGEASELVPVDGSGLGLLADASIEVLRRGRDLVAMTPEIRRFFFEPAPLIITKANVVARVHRRVHMDYVGIKTFDSAGRPAGELRIVGLFTSQAYTQSPHTIPLLREKVASVLAILGYSPASHAGKAASNTLDTFPRDELFQIEAARLAEWTASILDLELRPRVRVLARVDRFDRFVSVIVYAPRDRYSTRAREAIAGVLAEAYGGRVSAAYPTLPEGPLARVQFIIGRSEGATPSVSERDLERRIVELLRTFEDRLAEGLASHGPDAGRLNAKYARAFSAGYTETFATARALEDIERIERLGPDRAVSIDFYRDAGDPPARVRAAIYRLDQPIPLSERVPVLENLGFRVIDERSWRVNPRFAEGARVVALHDMVLESADGAPMEIGAADERLEACVLAVLAGEADSDNFNRLVATAGADWREVAMLRAIAAYLRQIGVPFGPRYMGETLARHAGLARDLIELFRTRHDPDIAQAMDARRERVAAIKARIEGALASVSSLDEDRILRLFLDIMEATSRTNFFARDPAGRPLETIAFKLASRTLTAAPEPKPFAEIWVYSPRVEGVHLRFAPIARGGIRWSDRAQDFRTEVLGLCKAQQVKNAVIVPAGAKGGFLPKLLPRGGSRDQLQAEGIAAYRIFIGALLDITDNFVEGALVPPPRVVRHDGDDPYLVVAADKGTATFSDIANEISIRRGHWLGDAFASGGSAGYDHKVMAITSRGGFECVKRHFREIDRDIQRDPFTAAGVGDMSGDVFGNGMLQSPAMRLVAAFDHRDIFIDPDPDPTASLAERRRLFALARSSWADYDKARLSPGGGIYSRAAKSIPLSAEVRRLLRTDKETMTPAEVMRLILTLEVDLIWFGGIGTFVRGSGESDQDVSDRANDPVRITGRELKARVIGEGANLAMTQRGRIEYAAAGGRLNTDFIDNSAGVNTSDQEVNIKIALGPAVKAGRLAGDARKALLAGMTEAVGRASLRNNYQQSLALSLAERRSVRDLGFNHRLMQALEARKALDRRLEALPTNTEIGERQRAGRGLVRPELAVLLSYSKIALLHDLLASGVPDEPFFDTLLVDYFPPALSQAYGEDIRAHRLRREIIATALTNMLVNRCGPSAPVRLADETGRTATDVVLAAATVRAIFALPEVWRRIDALDGRITGEAQLALYARVQDLLLANTAFFLRQPSSGPLADTIARHRAGLRELARDLPAIARPAALVQLAATTAEIGASRVPEDLARHIAEIELLAEAPAIVTVAGVARSSVTDAARAHWEIGEVLRIADISRKAAAITVTDYYDRLALASAEAALAGARRALTLEVLDAGRGSTATDWIAANAARLARVADGLAEVAAAESLSVSRLSVVTGRLGDLLAR